MSGLQGRIAVVTGASRANGIGAAVCRELARHRAGIFFTHWTPFDEAQSYESGGGPDALLAELRATGVPAAAMAVDLGNPGAAPRLLDAVQRELGAPAILVNNATHWEPASFRDLTEAVVDAHTAVNVRGTLMLSVEFARRTEGSGWGRIISLVSGQDRSGEAENLPYGATKGAISAFTRYLAVEVAPLGITVNAVDPGPTDTGWMDATLKQELLQVAPTGRLGRPEDAARLIAFLASDAAEWITGQVIHSDGAHPLA